MPSIKHWFVICQLLTQSILCSGALKIGISKPLSITTTMAPSTTMEITSEEISSDAISIFASSTTATIQITTAKTSTTPEWPEFPPKKTSKTSSKTTTEKPSSTTSTTIGPLDFNNNTDIADSTESKLVISSPKRTLKQKYCFCDLTKDLCDINCCCDHDCTTEILKVFRCLSETHTDLELLSKERLEDFKFQHGLPSCEVNDGWLCVFRIYKPVVQKEAPYFLKDTAIYYKWPNLLLESENIKSREFYKFGDLLRIINVETKEIQNFDLPASFQSSACRIQEPIYYLKPSKRSCLVSSNEDLKQIELKLLQFEEKYKILQTPIIPDDIYNNKDLEYFIGNITIYKCFGRADHRNCTRYKYDKENAKFYKLFKVKVNILHNFTNIQETVLDLWLKDLKEDKYFENIKQDNWLTYETEFFNKTLKEFNASNNTAFPKISLISGPLGYLPGKPLIIARYVPFNKSQPLSTKNQIINYFSSNNTESQTLALPAKEMGECKRSKNYQADFISYGINVAKYCKIKLENETRLKEEPSSTNFTEICFNLQQRIHEQLFGQDLDVTDLSSYFISQLGKPQNLNHKWVQLQVFNRDFDSVVGQYLHETNTFVCRNILLSLVYEFHITNLMVDNVPLQNTITSAVLHLAERHDLEFSLNENLEVPVTITVRFFDMQDKVVSAGYSFKINLIFYLIFNLGILSL